MLTFDCSKCNPRSVFYGYPETMKVHGDSVHGDSTILSCLMAFKVHVYTFCSDTAQKCFHIY